MTNKDKMKMANIKLGDVLTIYDNDTRCSFTGVVSKVNESSFIINGDNYKPSKFYADGGMTFRCGKKYIEIY